MAGYCWGLWRDSLQVTCWLTACTPGSAPGPTLGNEYGKTLPFSGQLRLLQTNLQTQYIRRLSLETDRLLANILLLYYVILCFHYHCLVVNVRKLPVLSSQ